MSFPTKDDRHRCWNAKDQYWECLNENEIKPDVCSKLREIYVSSCSSQWVKHFDRKRKFLKFKDKIDIEGYEPIDSKP